MSEMLAAASGAVARIDFQTAPLSGYYSKPPPAMLAAAVLF